MIVGALLRKLWPYLAIAGLIMLLIVTGGQVTSLRRALRDQQARIRHNREIRNAGDAVERGVDATADRMRDGDF